VSTDFDVCCDRCRLVMHAGQRYADGSHSFGYSSKDEPGRAIVARFTFVHAYHGPVRVVVSDTFAHKLSDGYKRLDDDDPKEFERAMDSAAQAVAESSLAEKGASPNG
jgi:hypothetical protein